VVAVVRVHGVEPGDVDARLDKALEEGTRGAEGTDAVVDERHAHALRALGDERIGELQAHLIVLDDVGLHVDVVARRRDGLEHGVVGGRTVLQQRDPVAHDEGTAGDLALQREMALEDAGVLPSARQPREHGLALLRGERPVRAVDLHGPGGAGTGLGVDGGKGAAAAGRREGQRN